MATRMSPAEFLRSQHVEIIAEWGERCHSLPHAKALPGLVLLDNLPQFLDELANRLAGSSSRMFEAFALEHTIERCRHGIPLREVVSEYEILREVIKNRYAPHGGGFLPATFDQTLEDAMEETVTLYKRAGEECGRRTGPGVGNTRETKACHRGG
jgi:hypothetical protein